MPKARRLKQLRKQRGWSARKLGVVSGVAASTVLGIEDGKRRARGETIYKIATALEVFPDQILEFREQYGYGPEEEVFIIGANPEQQLEAHRRMLRSNMEALPEHVVDLEYRRYKDRTRQRRSRER